MSVFRNLPLDILPSVLDHLTALHDLTAACHVSKAFYSVAVPILYRSISIVPEGKNRVIQLLTTLANCQRLARNIRRLEIRDFPQVYDFRDWDVITPPALRNCINLHACVWTRYGSLKPHIIQALHSCPIIELEITADAYGGYDPSDLLLFSNLRSLTLVLPASHVNAILGPWTYAMQNTLRSFSIISDLYRRGITDSLLASIAPNLVNLEELRIIGCDRVTHAGIAAILVHTGSVLGIRSLDLQRLSPSFDLEALYEIALMHPRALLKLQHVSLSATPSSDGSHTARLSSSWCAALCTFLSSTSNLETLYIFAHARAATGFTHINADSLYTTIAIQHGSHLIRLAAHDFILSPPALAEICTRCVVLEEFTFGFELANLKHLGTCLSNARRLRCVHINFPWPRDIPNFGEIPVIGESAPSEEETIQLVRACSSTLASLGINWQAWEVERVYRQDADGQLIVDIKLMNHHLADIPSNYRIALTAPPV